MRSPALTAVLAAAALAALAPLAQATTVDVAVGGSGFTFSPQTVNIQAGDSVRFTNAGGFHNVVADNGSFRCAEDCTATGGDPSSAGWSFTIQYSQAGTFGHHCEVHGSPGAGMFGTVVVASNTPPPQAGTLGFDHSAYSVAMSAGAATITVDRSGGDAGSVSVHYATSNGTAVAGQDYTAASGTLSWADGDGTAKSFQVPITNDPQSDPNETVHLTLSSPTGGASLGTSSATLTILGSGGGGTAPAAPSGLTATAQSTSEIQLHWTDNSTNETGFRVQMRTLDGTFADVPPVLAAGSTSTVVSGLNAGTGYAFQVRAENAAGSSAYTREAQAATDTALPVACADDATDLCLDSRFRASVAWRAQDGSTGQGSAVPIASAPQSGLFYFFSATNIEMLLKVLNACTPALGNKFWTFYAATTNVQFTLTVVDTQTGKTRVYFTPLGQAAPPVQDVSAFSTCP